MTKEEREKLIDFCYESAKEFMVMPHVYEELTDAQLKNEAKWFEYLWTK